MPNFQPNFSFSPIMEKLCLKWNDFEQNIISAFGLLRQDTDLVDVTLVSEDGQQVDLHKVVLASSSPFFLQLLKQSKQSQHPWIFMRGCKYEHLMAIVDFLYFGEANVLQENLDGFLALAAELQLKGLLRNNEDEKAHKAESQLPKKKKKRKDSEKTVMDNNQVFAAEDGLNYPNLQTPKSDRTIAVQDQVQEVVDLEGVDQKIRLMMEKSQENFDSAGRAAIICKVCGKEGQRSNIWNHIEAKHVTSDVSYTCDLCGKGSKSRNGLFLHKSIYHRK